MHSIYNYIKFSAQSVNEISLKDIHTKTLRPFLMPIRHLISRVRLQQMRSKPKKQN